MAEVLVLPASAIVLPDAPATWGMADSESLASACWRERAPCETDEAWLQLIPYVLLRHADGRLWCYRRVGGDERLQESCSCGLGGHVERCDSAVDMMATLRRCARRELTEELADPGPVIELHPLAWIYEGVSAIGRVHLGVLFHALWSVPEPPRIARGEPMAGLGFRTIDSILGDQRFELWSRLAAAHLQEASL